jgi:hypothetical protein
MPLVTLVMASGPGFPAGSPAHRYEIEVALNGMRQLDGAAWRADPNPWPARRIWPDGPPRDGDVQYDPEAGWSLSFQPLAGEAADAAPQVLIRHATQFRPGEYVTIGEPDGRDYGYRIVSVG